MVVMGGYQYFSLIAKKGTIFLTLSSCLQVLIGKSKGANPVTSLLLLQRIEGIGHEMTGILHSMTEKSNEIYKV